MKNPPFDLAIIIVNFNGGTWLDLTLTSLHKFYLSQTKLKVVTYLVDNASTDNSLKKWRRKSWLRIIELPENIGFAAGNNVALQEILDANLSPQIMLLNSDMQLDERSNFDSLVQALADQKKAAVITPQVILPDGSLDPACHRGEPTLWAAATYFSGLAKIWPKSKLFNSYHQGHQDFSQPHQIDACSGAAMVVKTSAIKEVGLLDERFFMYAEDLDWCRRFREAGYQIVYYPAVTVMHHKHKSGLMSGDRARISTTHHHFYDTMLQYFDKHHQARYPSVIRWLIQRVISIKKRTK